MKPTNKKNMTQKNATVNKKNQKSRKEDKDADHDNQGRPNNPFV